MVPARSLPFETLRQGKKPGLIPKRSQPRIELQIGQHGGAFLVGALEITKRLVALSEAGVHQGEVVGRHVLLVRVPGELVEDVPGQRMVTRILDTNLGYSGSWTYVFAPSGDGTQLTITENGEVSNVLFRFMSRYFFSQTATIEAYLTALARRVGAR